jgi:hypothetical protein
MTARKRSLLPKSIPILGEKFKIYRKKNLHHEGEKVEGLCCTDTHQIWIDSALNEDAAFIIMIHECNHAFLEITGLNQHMEPAQIEMFCQLNSYYMKQLVKGIA